MEFQIRKADANEYERIIQIIQEVHAAMPNKEWFVADNADYTRSILAEKKGTAYVAFWNDTSEIAGLFIATIPGLSDDNLGLDAGLSQEELLQVIHMDSVAVLPSYRGYRLQRKLMQTAEDELKTAGYRYLFCTIHPENPYSMNNATALDYHVVKICEKYGGYLRAVLMKKL